MYPVRHVSSKNVLGPSSAEKIILTQQLTAMRYSEMRYIHSLQQNDIRICKVQKSLADVKQTLIYPISNIFVHRNVENIL